MIRRGFIVIAILSVGVRFAVSTLAAAAGDYASHPPMRTTPVAVARTVTNGPAYFVDAAQGDDANDGSQAKPWKTVTYAAGQLQPGDTLYLRAGTYYERPYLRRSGTPEAPITIAAYPGEAAIIDGGVREFHDDPAGSWEPCADGGPDEFVSTKTYPGIDDRQVPHQFLPVAWEPLWGIETQRPIALGNFADSMVPLHGYRTASDLRAATEIWPAGGKKDADVGAYCGPGLWFNRETGRVHIRLSHTNLSGLGDRAYRGETDPRKLRLIVALGFGHDVLRISGVSNVRIQDITLRGATGSPMVHIYGAENVALDHLTIYGGFPGLLVNASKGIRVTHSAFRGLASPWIGRGHMKYRGTASYQVVFQNSQPMNENIEIANCEFTDDHDCAFFRYVKNLQFHHNYVDNFNDDGIECGPKLREHTIYIYQNRIGACLGMFQQHELEKDESPVDYDPAAGVFVYRNVLDPRKGVWYHTPMQPDPSGDIMRHEGMLLGDHGGPMFPVMRFYHNTILRRTPAFRNYFLFGIGVMGLRNTERHVFNNILVQADGVPGTVAQAVGNLHEGGNLLWTLAPQSAEPLDPFAKFRASKQFAESQKFYEAGWTTHDRFADPRLQNLSANEPGATDLRLAEKSPAIDAGLALPAEWPDAVRKMDAGKPDIGALPYGAKPWGVGIDGRIPLFGDDVGHTK
jgi:hypothetical protein